MHIVSRHEHAVSELVAAAAIDLSVEYIAGHLTFVNEEILVPEQWLGTCSVAVANMDQYNVPFSCPAGFSTFSCEIRESCVALHPEGNQLNDVSYGHHSLLDSSLTCILTAFSGIHHSCVCAERAVIVFGASLGFPSRPGEGSCVFEDISVFVSTDVVVLWAVVSGVSAGRVAQGLRSQERRFRLEGGRHSSLWK